MWRFVYYLLTQFANDWATNECSCDVNFVTGITLNAGDVITLYDVTNGASWAITNVNPYSSGNPVGSATGITIGQSGTYDIYVQFLFENDKIYFGPAGA